MLEGTTSPTPSVFFPPSFPNSARLQAVREELEVFVRRGVTPQESLLCELDVCRVFHTCSIWDFGFGSCTTPVPFSLR